MPSNREISFDSELIKSYRYSFQGQESSKEYWEGAVEFKYRVEDARLGRFFSVDPLFKNFAWNSNYAFSENSVIESVELEGLERVNANSVGLRSRTSPWIGNKGVDYGFSEPLTAQAAKRNNGYMGSGAEQQKFFFDPNALFSNGKRGAYIWEFPTPFTTNTNTPLGLVAMTPPLPNAPILNSATFSFDNSQSSGLTPAQTAILTAAIPPIGMQTFVPTGPAAITATNTTNGVDGENLPFTTTTTNFTTPGTITTIGATQVNVIIQTGWAGPTAPAPGGATAGNVIAARQNLLRNQLIAQGVSGANITFTTQWGQNVPNGNQVTVQTSTASTNQQVQSTNQTSTTNGFQYSE